MRISLRFFFAVSLLVFPIYAQDQLLTIHSQTIGKKGSPDSIQGTIQIDRKETTLSGKIVLAIEIEGPSPLRVTIARPPLTSENAQLWRVRESSPANTEFIAPNRERFRQRYDLIPYVTNDKVPIQLLDAKVRSGTSTTDSTIQWDNSRIPPIRVTTEITEVTSSAIRPPTDIETLPTAVSPTSGDDWWIFWIGLGIIVLLLGLQIFRRHSHSKPNQVPYSLEWTLQELHQLGQTPLPGSKWLQRLSGILRHYLEARYPVPAVRLTTMELLHSLQQLESFPQTALSELRSRLELCDVAKYTEGLIEYADFQDRLEWASWAHSWIVHLNCPNPMESHRANFPDLVNG